jgi:hypothetical protein
MLLVTSISESIHYTFKPQRHALTQYSITFQQKKQNVAKLNCVIDFNCNLLAPHEFNSINP